MPHSVHVGIWECANRARLVSAPMDARLQVLMCGRARRCCDVTEPADLPEDLPESCFAWHAHDGHAMRLGDWVRHPGHNRRHAQGGAGLRDLASPDEITYHDP